MRHTSFLLKGLLIKVHESDSANLNEQDVGDVEVSTKNTTATDTQCITGDNYIILYVL